MDKINLDLNFEEMVKSVESKARADFKIPASDKVDDFRFDFKDADCQKVCITIGGKEFCWCL